MIERSKPKRNLKAMPDLELQRHAFRNCTKTAQVRVRENSDPYTTNKSI